jgi:hypothetical protein
MPGLMARILSRRADGAPPTAPDFTDAPPADQPVLGVPAHGDAPARPSFRNRSTLRRRLRYLRRVREIAFRDLGGLVFDLDRFERDRPDLVAIKLAGLNAIDAELRALEEAVDDVRDFEELQEAGVSACASCGALHGSEARFCPSCGVAVDTPGAPAAELPAAAPAEPAPQPAPPAEGATEPEQPAA